MCELERKALRTNEEQQQCDQIAVLFVYYLGICKTDTIYQSKLKMLPNTKWTLLKWPRFLNVVLKWRNCAKSGHTEWQRVIRKLTWTENILNDGAKKQPLDSLTKQEMIFNRSSRRRAITQVIAWPQTNIGYDNRGAAIVQWIHLRLPSCCPGFESQAHHLCLNIYRQICAIFVTWK